jgi:hypothetical protein
MFIQKKQEYCSAIAEIEGYLQKGFSDLTVSEDEHLYKLSKVVKGWELKEYPLPFNVSQQGSKIYCFG